MAFTPTDATKAEVRVTGSAPNQQLDFYIPAGPKGDTGIGGPAGPSNALTILGTATGPQQPGTPGPQGPAGDPSAYELRGAVAPNGVVTANPGTYYTDTAGTNGAWRWMKTSGTGNTGWIVTSGDTGWRLVNAWAQDNTGAANTVTGNVYVKRVGDTVHYAISRTTFLVSLWLVPTAGFLPQNNRTGDMHFDQWDNTALRVLYWNGTKWFPSSAPQWVANVQMSTSHIHYTPDAWPTTLPGTPA